MKLYRKVNEMVQKKNFKLLFAAAAITMSMLLTGCGNQGARSSAEATPENPFVLTHYLC